MNYRDGGVVMESYVCDNWNVCTEDWVRVNEHNVFHVHGRDQAGAPVKASGQTWSLHNDVCGGCIHQIVWGEECITHDYGKNLSSYNVFHRRSHQLGVVDHVRSSHGGVVENSNRPEGVVDLSVCVVQYSNGLDGDDDHPSQAGDGVLRCRSPRLHRSDVETVWKMSPRPGDWKSAAKAGPHVHLSVADETGVRHASQFGAQLWLMPVQ